MSQPTYTAMYDEVVIVKLWLMLGMLAYTLLVMAAAKAMAQAHFFGSRFRLHMRRENHYRQSRRSGT